jgi:hypothetical protein
LLVEARLLARQTSEDIARLTGVAVDIVDAYERFFFACRDRLGARDWILCQAIYKNGDGLPEPKTAVVFKSFAYFGGPRIVDAVAPYLVGGQALFEPGLDLSTASGRREQMVRLAVASYLLPDDEKTRRRLALTRAFWPKRTASRPISAPSAAFGDSNLALLLGEALLDVMSEPVKHSHLEAEQGPGQQERQIA